MKYFLYSSLIILFALCSKTCLSKSNAKSSSSTAAIPRSKSKSTGSSITNIFGQGIIQKVFREIKISFCSELEALSLQLTRPVPDAISMSSMDDIINFVNIEFDNPQLMISLLVKFSRKFAESNVYTKLKSILVLHKLMENVKESAQIGLLKSVRSLRVERDEKVDMLFFSPDSIEKAAELASNVAEIQAVELARVYSAYVFNFIDTKGMQPSTSSTSSSSTSTSKASSTKVLKSVKDIEDRMNALVNLVEHGDEVEICIKRTFTPLGQQCLDAVKEDRSWIIKELKKLYLQSSTTSIETFNKLENRVVVEELLSKYDTKFIRIKTSPSPIIVDHLEKTIVVEGNETKISPTAHSLEHDNTSHNKNDDTTVSSNSTKKTIIPTNPTSTTKPMKKQMNTSSTTKKATSNKNKSNTNATTNNSNTTTKSNKPITSNMNKKSKK